MIVGINKIKDMEFGFPIVKADKAMYKIDSVNELSEVKSFNFGDWGAVILARYIKDSSPNGIVPEHIVFTIEYDNKVASTYKISCVTSNNETAKIEVSKVAVSTPENFFKCLEQMAELIKFII